MVPALIVNIAAVTAWALVAALGRVVMLRLGVDPWAFSFLQLTSGGLFLLVIARFFGARAPDRSGHLLISFRRPSTWILGTLRVISAAIYTVVLGWLSVLETGSIGTLSVPLGAAGVWLALGRRPARGEWIGHAVIFAAIGVILMGLGPELRLAAGGLMAVNAALIVAVSIIAETHPDNVTGGATARLRFTGAVLLITALIFVVARLFQTTQSGAPWDATLIWVSIGFGICLRAPSMLLAFWAIRLSGTQTYLAATAFLPLIGMGFEEVFVATGLIETTRFDGATLGLALAVLTGVLMVVWARARSVT